MGIPLVALQSQGPEIAKGIGDIGRRQLSLRKLLDEQKTAAQEQHMNQLKIQQAQQQQNEQAALQQAYQESGGDIDKLMQIAPARGVSPDTMIKLQDSVTAHKKSMLDLDNAQWTAIKNKNSLITSGLDSILTLPTEEAQSAAWPNVVKQLAQQGALSPEEAQQYAQYPGKDAVRQLDMQRKTGEQINTQIDNERAAAAETRAAEEFAAKKAAGTLGGALASSPATIQEYNLAKSQGFKGTFEDWLKQTKPSTTALTLTPEAVDMAAQNYVITGTMPALGMGSPVIRQQILNRAAQVAGGGGVAPGSPGAIVAANKAGYVSDQAALTQLQRNRSAVGAFENTALPNLKLFEDQATKVVDTGSPWINQPLRAVARGALGSADQAAFDAARTVATTEIARVVAQPNLVGQLTDEARSEMQAALAPNATLKQIFAASKILRQDMTNRKSGLDKEIQTIQDRIRGGTSGGGVTEGEIELERGPDGKLRVKGK